MTMFQFIVKRVTGVAPGKKRKMKTKLR